MESAAMQTDLTYQQRLEALRKRKLDQTAEKRRVIGAMDYDDWALVLPPPELRKVVELMGPSGVPIKDVLLATYTPVPNHPSGGFFGPESVGRNYRLLLEAHPVYIDPLSSLAGAYMTNFFSYRRPNWNPDLSFDRLKEDQERYQLVNGIGGVQHFCQDFSIGLRLGWGGVLAKIRRYREEHGPEKRGFYDGLEQVVLGIQEWIARHAAEARRLAAIEPNENLRRNLEELAAINESLVSEPPASFRAAAQWLLWALLNARMYNGSGSLGRLDKLLQPYYERDKAQGLLSDEETVFHLACLLLRDTSYIQLGGYDAHGNDDTNPLSYLVLEAARRLKIPANIGVCVGERIAPELLDRGVALMLENKTGIPKFLGLDRTAAGFARNGYPLEEGWNRVYSGCHWCAIPGREYAMHDLVKINLAAVFNVALREMMEQAGRDATVIPSTAVLWRRFERHLRRAVEVIAAGLDVHMKHMHEVFPELVMDLLCHGPIEKGLDATAGSLEYYNLAVDAAGLATVADSFAALEQQIERSGRFTWEQVRSLLDTNWRGPEGEKARRIMKNSPRYGSGGSIADEYARRVAETFTRLVKERPTSDGYTMLPGLFSWALAIGMGRTLAATPNGRFAGDPISHGCNPDPGFRRDGASTAVAAAVASVQPGYGNTAPMQIDVDPGLGADEEGRAVIRNLIRSHFELGGTQINMNVVDADKVLAAHKDPNKYPDLVVRVTGFSAYFASLSPELRQLVVDRILREGR